MIVYDAGALVAADRNDRRMWALHDAALRREVAPIVPAGVLAQAWRGGPQPSLSRLLAGCLIASFDERQARDAGALCAESGTADVIDAAVVVLARTLEAPVVTGDASDLRRLADAAGFRVTLHEI